MSVCLAAQKFIKLNAVAAVVFLLLGGIAAILLALTRWQAVHLLPVDWFYRILTFHGLNMLIFWILFFEIAVLYFACTVPLKAQLYSKKIAWTSFGMMLAGAVMVDVTILQGRADVLLTSYLPLLADPKFYLGIILVAVGTLVLPITFSTLVEAGYVVRRRGSGSYVTERRRMPHGLDSTLSYLAMIESGFVPTARSPVHSWASGKGRMSGHGAARPDPRI